MVKRQTTRVPVELPQGDSAPERWLANIRVSGFTVLMLVLVVAAIVVLAPSLKLLIEQRTQIAALEKAVADKKNEVSNLDDQVARWDDPAYIEAQARNRLMFVYPGEYSFLVNDDTAKTTTKDDTPISSKIQTTQVDWVKTLMSSVLTAGLTTKAPSSISSPEVGSQ